MWECSELQPSTLIYIQMKTHQKKADILTLVDEGLPLTSPLHPERRKHVKTDVMWLFLHSFSFSFLLFLLTRMGRLHVRAKSYQVVLSHL